MSDNRYEEGYTNGYNDGFEEGERACIADKIGFSVEEFRQTKAQRDAAWEYLRENEIHLLNEMCWCSPIRHSVV